LFSLPDNWINGLHNMGIDGSSYLVNTTSINDTILSEPLNSVYSQKLALENDKSSTLDEAFEFRSKFQKSIDKEDFIYLLKNQIGFNPIRRSFAAGTINNVFDRNQIELPILFKKGAFKNSFVIALHGRNSSPEALFGYPSDYSNKFVEFWQNSGFNVYALGVGSPSNFSVNFPRLGLSEIGSDLAKIEDLVHFIIKTYGVDSHIVIVGISYGAKLAEYSALLFNEIDGVVSIGGSARYDYLASEFSLSFKNSIINSDIWLNQCLSGLKIYEFILMENKFLLSSTGVSDAGQFGDSGQSKFIMMKSFLNNFRSTRFSYFFFTGVHESNPKNEVSEYLNLLNKNNIILY
jgi:pimeloyl-ACP methyl ester carboxylesterase